MTHIKRTIGICVAVAVAGAAIIAAAAQGGDDPGGDERAVSTPPPVAALAQPRGADDRLPEVAATELASLGLPGSNAAASVRTLAHDGWSLYLTPADDGVCLSLTDPDGGASVGCQRSSALERGPASPAAVLRGCSIESPQAAPKCDRALLYGIVPDGFDRVTVAVRDGESPTAAIVGNSYLVEVSLDRDPTVVRFTGGDKVVERPAGVSALAN